LTQDGGATDFSDDEDSKTPAAAPAAVPAAESVFIDPLSQTNEDQTREDLFVCNLWCGLPGYRSSHIDVFAVYTDPFSASGALGADIDPWAGAGGHSYHAHHEPAHHEPAHHEPVYQEPVQEEPAREEPIHQEPVREEPAFEEPGREEPEVAQEHKRDSPFEDSVLVEDPLQAEPWEEAEKPATPQPVAEEKKATPVVAKTASGGLFGEEEEDIL